MDKFKTDKFKCQIKFKRTLWPHRLSTPDRFIFSMSFFVLVKDDQFLSFDTLSQVTKTCYGQYWTPDVCKCPSVCVWISSILSVKRSNASIFWSSLIQNVVTVNVQKKKKKKTVDILLLWNLTGGNHPVSMLTRSERKCPLQYKLAPPLLQLWTFISYVKGKEKYFQ